MNWIEYGLLCALGYFLIGLISFQFVTKLNINSLAFNTAQHIACILFSIIAAVFLFFFNKKFYTKLKNDFLSIFDFSKIKNILGILFFGIPIAIANACIYQSQRLATEKSNINPGIPSAIGQFYLVSQTIIVYLVYNIKIKPINFIGILLFILSVFLLSYSSSIKEAFTIEQNYLWLFYSFIAIVCYSIGTFPPFMFQTLYKNINPIIIALVQFIGEATAGILFSLYYSFNNNRNNKNHKNNILHNFNEDLKYILFNKKKKTLVVSDITNKYERYYIIIYLISLVILSYLSVASQYKSWSLATSPGLANTIQALYVIFFALYKAIVGKMSLTNVGSLGLITTIISIYFITS